MSTFAYWMRQEGQLKVVTILGMIGLEIMLAGWMKIIKRLKESRLNLVKDSGFMDLTPIRHFGSLLQNYKL